MKTNDALRLALGGLGTFGSLLGQIGIKPLGTERLNAAVCQKIHSDPFALTNPICFCSRYRLSFVLSDKFRASPRPTAFYLVPRKRSTISGSIGSTASV